MAESRDPRQVYDNDNSEQPVTRPDLRAPLNANRTGGPAAGATDSTGDRSRSGSEKAGRRASRDDLQQAEEGGGLYNAGGDQEGSGKSASPGSLQNSERSANRKSLYNPDPETSRFQRTKSRAGKLLKNKWLVGGFLGGGSFIAIIVVLLVILAGALKIVSFAEHVAAYQFARTARQMSKSTERITAERMAIEVADDSLYKRIKTKYEASTGKVKDTWSKLDKYRPNKIISNFEGSKTLTFNHEKSLVLRRDKLKSVTINGEEIGVAKGGARRLIPGYKFAKNISFSKQFAPALDEALKSSDIGPITRAKVAREIRQRLGISLTAWIIGKYAGKSENAAKAQVERDALAVAEGSDSPRNPKINSERVNDEAEKAKTALDDAVKDPDKLDDIVKSGGELPVDLIDTVNKSFTDALFSSVGGFIRGVVGLVNPIYEYAVPLCLIYDGSLSQSGPTIDNQSRQLQRSAVWVQSASAQQKDGYNASGEAVGATNWKLGDTTKSNAERRASGLPVNTSNYQSTQASPTGEYSIADYGLGPQLGGIVDALAGPVCPVATNIWTGIGVGVASVFLTPGIGTAGKGAVDGATATLGSRIVSRILATAAESGKAFRQIFSKKTLATLGVIGAGTIVAKLLVMSQISATHNSLATGESYNNDVDDGTNQYANQVNQQQFYGAPMSDNSLSADDSSNRATLAVIESRKSTFERYLDTQNPNSLLSRTAIMSSGYLNHSFFASLLKAGSSLLSPLRTLGTALRPLTNQTVFAAAPVTSANSYYGNVQWGYTAEENGLIDDSNKTYGDPLENQEVLDNSGKEDKIAEKYKMCFDGSKTIGELLSNEDIKRDKKGNVLADDSTCSPKSLGPHNPTYGDLVFRWRLANNYNNTLDQLICDQDIDSGACGGQDSAAGSDSTPSTEPPQQTTACNVDFSAAPDLEPKAANIKKTCQENFPKTEDILSPSPHSPPHKIIFDQKDFSGKSDFIAFARDGIVHLSINFYRAHPEDKGQLGIIVHEETHVVQEYGSKYNTPKAPSWVAEGMADYVRAHLGYTDDASYHCANNTYLDGYNCAAVFFDFISDRYEPNIVKEVHTAIRKGKYNDRFIESKTGHSLTEMYRQCLKSNCAGGKKI